jgi:hypothetical protein
MKQQHYPSCKRIIEFRKTLIEKFSGTFVKEIGDGLLAYFSTADRAVSCCYEIQKQINAASGLKVRIGLNQAEIIIENNDIFGDGVNIASRSDVDPNNIAFYGMSWGPFIGVVLSGVETRIKTNVLSRVAFDRRDAPKLMGSILLVTSLSQR